MSDNYLEKLNSLSNLPDLTRLISKNKETVEKEKSKINKTINDSMIIITGMEKEIINIKKSANDELEKIKTAISSAEDSQKPILEEIEKNINEMLNLNEVDKSLNEIEEKLTSVKSILNNDQEDVISNIDTNIEKEVSNVETALENQVENIDKTQSKTESEKVNKNIMEQREELIKQIKNEWLEFKENNDPTKYEDERKKIAQKLKDFDDKSKDKGGKYTQDQQTPRLVRYINELGGLKGGKKVKKSRKKRRTRRKPTKKLKK